MKELKPHPQAEWLIAMAQGKTVQRLTVGGLWVGASLNCLCNYPSGTFRINPEIININGYEVYLVRERLSNGQKYWVPDVKYPDEQLYDSVTWNGDNADLERLKAGVIHLTEAAAIAHAEALLSFTRSDK